MTSRCRSISGCRSKTVDDSKDVSKLLVPRSRISTTAPGPCELSCGNSGTEAVHGDENCDAEEQDECDGILHLLVVLSAAGYSVHGTDLAMIPEPLRPGSIIVMRLV